MTLTDTNRISIDRLLMACASVSETIEKVMTKKVYRRNLSEDESNKKSRYLNIVARFRDELLSLNCEGVLVSDVTRMIATLSSYPGAMLLKKILILIEDDQELSLCSSILKFPEDSSMRWISSPCMVALEKMATGEAIAVMSWCVKRGPHAPEAARCLMKTLGFPPVGEAARASGELVRNFSEERGVQFLHLLGIDADTFEFDAQKARAFHGKAYSDMGEIISEPEKVVAVDLSWQKFRSFPEDLLLCTNLKYLIIEDDYFRDNDMRRIEEMLPGVEIGWTCGQYVDGKHGR